MTRPHLIKGRSILSEGYPFWVAFKENKKERLENNQPPRVLVVAA
jgi:hypothetical protein